MQKDITQGSSATALKRVVELWPYIFIAISVAGFAYVAFVSR